MCTMFVNPDYKKWHLFVRVHKYLQTFNAIHKVAIVTDNNEYLINYVKDKKWIIITHDYFNLKSEQFDIIMILKEIAGISKQNTNDKIINVYNEYMDYENSKIPTNYIVDEFNDDPNKYDNYILNKEELAQEYIKLYNNKFFAEKRIFNKIEIETINRCNNDCSFCPINVHLDTRTYKVMSKQLFEDIIKQLSQINYCGALALFSNNEPLLDQRLYEFACIARKELPNVYLYIFTNGKLLSVDLLEKLLVPFDHIHINNYNNDKTLNKSIRIIHDYLVNNSIPIDKVSIHLRNKNEIISSRGGTSPNKNHPLSLRCGCILPFSQLVIRPDGNISLCSNDALGKITLGNVTSQSILDIWFGQKFEAIRKKVKCSRSSITPCKKCDFIFTPLYFERI